MAMSISNLKVFINVADAGNITRAAEVLHITQPAVSKAVKNLEDELGVSLFFRDKRNGLTLTDTGERILGFARRMVLMEEKIYQTAYLARNMLEGTLKIATLPYGSLFFLVKAFSRFQEKYPQVNVEIAEGSTSEVNQMVSEHAAEFGISIVPATDFEYEVLKKDRIVAISKEPLKSGCVDLSRLKQRFYVSQPAWESIFPVLEQNHIKESGRFKIVSAQTVRSIAEMGIGGIMTYRSRFSSIPEYLSANSMHYIRHSPHKQITLTPSAHRPCQQQPEASPYREGRCNGHGS